MDVQTIQKKNTCTCVLRRESPPERLLFPCPPSNPQSTLPHAFLSETKKTQKPRVAFPLLSPFNPRPKRKTNTLPQVLQPQKKKPRVPRPRPPRSPHPRVTPPGRPCRGSSSAPESRRRRRARAPGTWRRSPSSCRRPGPRTCRTQRAATRPGGTPGRQSQAKLQGTPRQMEVP